MHVLSAMGYTLMLVEKMANTSGKNLVAPRKFSGLVGEGVATHGTFCGVVSVQKTKATLPFLHEVDGTVRAKLQIQLEFHTNFEVHEEEYWGVSSSCGDRSYFNAFPMNITLKQSHRWVLPPTSLSLHARFVIELYTLYCSFVFQEAAAQRVTLVQLAV